jgi:hypothetical protein
MEMNTFQFVVWTSIAVLFVCLAVWTGVVLMRWARRGSKGAALFGMGMGLPAALLNANPQPPKEIQIKEVAGQIQRKKNADSGDPEK